MSKHARMAERDFVFEIRNLHGPGSLGRLFTAIGNAEGLISDIVTTFVGKTHSIREITVSVFDEEHRTRVERAIAQYQGAEILQIKDPIFEMHKGGKIHSGRKRDVRTLAQLRYVYTPGVARVCTAIQQDKAKAREYTNIG